LRRAPGVVLAALALPVFAGLLGTLAPAFGLMAVFGQAQPGLAIFADLLAWAGFWPALWLSLKVGLVSTALSLLLVVGLVAIWQGSRSFGLFRHALAPLLAVPHAAVAFGLVFLIAPSGWGVRLLSPWATGWQRPPDLLIVQDPGGWALIAGLVVKEVPFLLLMVLAALGQSDASRAMLMARSLGYARPIAWVLAVFPLVYRQIRLPVLVVLAFSMTVVDVALILGPSTPPVLAVQITRWMNDPDLSLRMLGAAGAVVQLVLVGLAIALWLLAERGVARFGRRWAWAGHRRGPGPVGAALVLGGAMAVLGCVVLGLMVLALWSVSGLWSFPNLWPDTMGWGQWQRHVPAAMDSLWRSCAIAVAATVVALVLALTWLEAEARFAMPMGAGVVWLLYLPLLVPQIAFLPGVQTLMLLAGVQGGVLAVTLAHILFVFPYVFLVLSAPYRAWDARLGTMGRALGASPARVFWRLRLPMLLAPVLAAMAVGMAVSVGQYLPSLMIGGGRVSTLTTEAVALASGGDRRAIGVWALLQTALALAPFAVAVLLPGLWWRNRRGMRQG
jgi:putative thiamine transport system permease protein